MNAQTIDYNNLQRQVDAHPYPLVVLCIGGAPKKYLKPLSGSAVALAHASGSLVATSLGK